MSIEKMEQSNTLKRQECTLDRNGNAEPCKFQCISVITKTPYTSFKSSYDLEEEEITIVAEYNRKGEVFDGTKLAKEPSSVITEKERQNQERRRSGDHDHSVDHNPFWYVECGPEVIDLDNSDTESEKEHDYQQSDGAEANVNVRDEETFVAVQRQDNRFEVLEETSYCIPGQKIWKREMGVRIRRPNPDVDPVEWWDGAFRDFFHHLTSTCPTTDNAGITVAVVDSPHAPVSLSCRSIGDYIYEDLSNLIGSAGNRAAAFKMDDTFLITTCVVRGSISRELMGQDHGIAYHRSILAIRSDDMLSLPRSLVVSRVYAERGEMRSGELHRLWGRIRCGSGGQQLRDARDLAERAGVKAPKNGYSMRDVEAFQDYLARDGVAIMVYEISSLGRGGGALYNGTDLVRNIAGRVRHTLHLAYYERFRHYQPILNLQIAAGSRGFCAPCNASYSNEVDHECSNRCTQCFGSPPCVFDARKKVECSACNRYFFGSACFERHKAVRRRNDSVCQTIYFCFKSWSGVNNGIKKHDCCDTRHYKTRSRAAPALADPPSIPDKKGCF